jgi:hypothetical protein
MGQPLRKAFGRSDYAALLLLFGILLAPERDARGLMVVISLST